MSASVDGRFAFIRNYATRGIRVVSMTTGKQLCALYSFSDGSWAVLEPSGRYDGSKGGRVPSLHWVIDGEAIDIAQLPEYYEPGLLAKLLAGKTFDEIPPIRGRLFPQAKIESKDASLRLDLDARGGGLGKVVVNVNGSEWVNREASRTMDVDVSQAPNLKPGEDNVVEVWVYNDDGSLRSRGQRVRYHHKGSKNQAPTRLYAIVAGSSDYPVEELKLTWADDDAEAIGNALRIAARRLFDEDPDGRVHVRVLSSGSKPDDRPTVKNIERAFQQVIEQANPQDVLVVYLSGHGAAHGGQYYYLTEEARMSDLRTEALRSKKTVSVPQLVDLMRKTRTTKRILILDTCAAGQGAKEAAQSLAARDPHSAVQKKTLRQLNERTGSFILAGCAADRQSFEDNALGQGLLTYSLLEYMRQGELSSGETVQAVPMFEHAKARVATLSNERQQPDYFPVDNSSTFAIGRLLSEDRERIPLRKRKPFFLQSQLAGDDFSDPLDLQRSVNDALQQMAAGEPPPILYHPSSSSAEGYRIRGTYTMDAGRASARGALIRNRKVVARFSFPAEQHDTASLTRKIVAWALASAAAK